MAEPAPGLPYRRADTALAFLVALATLATFLALAFSERGLVPLLALVVTLCRHTLSETLAHGADLGRALLLVPLGLGWALAAWEAWRLSRPPGAGRRLWARSAAARTAAWAGERAGAG